MPRSWTRTSAGSSVAVALGDFLSPARILGFAVLISSLGVGGLLFADTLPLAYLSIVLLGVGYGAGYTSIPVAFADFFGRRACAGTAGARIAITGVVLWLGPRRAGTVADTTGSYASGRQLAAWREEWFRRPRTPLRVR